MYKVSALHLIVRLYHLFWARIRMGWAHTQWKPVMTGGRGVKPIQVFRSANPVLYHSSPDPYSPKNVCSIWRIWRWWAITALTALTGFTIGRRQLPPFVCGEFSLEFVDFLLAFILLHFLLIIFQFLASIFRTHISRRAVFQFDPILRFYSIEHITHCQLNLLPGQGWSSGNWLCPGWAPLYQNTRWFKQWMPFCAIFCLNSEWTYFSHFGGLVLKALRMTCSIK